MWNYRAVARHSECRPIASESGSIQGTPHNIVTGEDLGSLSGSQLSFSIPALTGATIVIGASAR